MASTKHLMNALIPLYSKVLDDKELDAALGFYNTPEGKSMLKKMPQLMQGGMQIGQQWGAQVGQRAAQKVIQKARALGYQI